MSVREVKGRRRHAILGGLVAGAGLFLGLFGGASAMISLFPVDTLFEPYPLGEDLIVTVAGILVLGLGAGMMVASTVR